MAKNHLGRFSDPQYWTVNLLSGVIAIIVFSSLAAFAAERIRPAVTLLEEGERGRGPNKMSPWVRFGHIGIDQLRIDLNENSPILVDARFSADFDNGHLAGAISIPPDMERAQIAKVLRQVTRGNEIIVYCESRECRLADETAGVVRDVIGYGPSIRVYQGGWEEWSRLNNK